MSKLPKAYQFTDISDYGRPFGRMIAKPLKDSRFTAIHITFAFVLAALISLGLLWQDHLKTAALFLV